MKFRCVLIFLLVSLLSTPLWTDSIDPKRQFLEVANHSDKNALIEIDLPLRQKRYKLEKYKIQPGKKVRFPGAFFPAMQKLRFWIGTKEHKLSIQVNNYGEKTFLYGKQLTIYKSEAHNIKRVRILHGKWTLKRRVGGGKWLAYEMNLSHVKSEFTGSFRLKSTGEKITIKGKMVGRVVNFSFGSLPGNRKVKGEIKISADGIWRGKLNITSMEKGGKGGYTCSTIKYRDPKKPNAAGWVVTQESGKVLTVHVGNRYDMYKTIFIRVKGIARWNSLGFMRFLRIGDHWNDAVEEARRTCQKWTSKTDTGRMKTSQIPITINANFYKKELVIR